jgi:signal transduction histidine kinase
MLEWFIYVIVTVIVGIGHFYFGRYVATRRCLEIKRELTASEEQNRVILNAIPDLIFRVHRDGTYIDFKGNESELAVPPDKIIGNNARDLLPSVQAESTMASIEKAVDTQEVQLIEYSLPTQSGQVQHFEARIAPAGGDEVLVIVRNINEQIRMRKLMIQTEKMMTVGGLAAGMAHEINNPLGGIIQGAQIITQRIDPNLTKNREAAKSLDLDLEKVVNYMETRKIIDSLSIIKESGNRAARIVNNMLKFTRKGDSHKSTQDINQLIDHAIDLATKDYDLKRKYDFMKISLRKNYDPHLPRIVCAESEIEQVLFNLLKNASQAMNEMEINKHTPPDYKPMIQIDTSLEDDQVLIKIKDNGPGVPDEKLPHLFEPFFTTKKTGSGTGLGLFVSYYIIVNNHKGWIGVDSQKGTGTTFSIKLPLNTTGESNHEI